MQSELASNKVTTLRQARLRRGLSLEALGYIAERDPATISRIERGLVEPERETVVRLARALGMSVGRFLSLLPKVEKSREKPSAPRAGSVQVSSCSPTISAVLLASLLTWLLLAVVGTTTVEELAELLRVSKWALYQAVREGTSPIPPIRVGRRILFSRHAVDALLGLNGEAPGAHPGAANTLCHRTDTPAPNGDGRAPE